MAFYSRKIVSNEFVGPIEGTSSFAVSASAASTASVAFTASFALSASLSVTASNANTASLAFTSSVVANQAYVRGKYNSVGIIPENTNNTASVATAVILQGDNNKTATAANTPVYLILGGNDNVISGSGWATLIGQSNASRGTTYPTIFGYVNTISGSVSNSHNMAVGFQNSLLGTSYAMAFGQNNIITNASYSMAIGRNLVITSSTSDAYVIGSNISASRSNTLHVNNLWVSGSIYGYEPGGGATVTISGSAPSGSKNSGSLWWNSEDGNLYVQVTAPTGSSYVPAVSSIANMGATYRFSGSGATWNINHNLNTLTPLVTVYSGSSVMIPSTIDSVDANNTRITFSGSVQGAAVLSTGIGGESVTLATTASFAQTASFVNSASFAQTASFAQPSLQAFIDGGALTIGATTTAPTKGTIVTDRVYYRQVGPKEYEVIYNWYNNSGGTTGTGDYLISLPAGLQFNSSALGQGFRTDVITGGQMNNGLGFAPAMMNVAYPLITAIPYDATRFRIFIYLPASGFPAFWGQSYGSLNQLSIFKLNFTFTAL